MPGQFSTKRCRNCGRDLPTDAFDQQINRVTGFSDGLKKSCRDCCLNWRQRQRQRSIDQTTQRFWRYVDKSAGEFACWIWIGSCATSGYGQFKTRTEAGIKNWRAHRFSYTLAFGEIAEGEFICHRCDNPRCVNPAHLFSAPPAVNTADGRMKGRIVRKLSPADLDAIRAEYATGTSSYSKLARQYDVTFGTIRDVIKGAIGAASEAERRHHWMLPAN